MRHTDPRVSCNIDLKVQLVPAGSRAYYALSYLENPRRAIEPFFLSILLFLYFAVVKSVTSFLAMTIFPGYRERNNEELPLPLSGLRRGLGVGRPPRDVAVSRSNRTGEMLR